MSRSPKVVKYTEIHRFREADSTWIVEKKADGTDSAVWTKRRLGGTIRAVLTEEERNTVRKAIEPPPVPRTPLW